MITIKEFAPGDRMRLVDFGTTDAEYRRLLLSMGFTCGTEIQVMHIAPLGCPVQIKIRDTMLALRKNEACRLLWERI